SPAVQTNGTQPLSKTWEHSLYELERTPQEAITDGLEIVEKLVSKRSLRSDLNFDALITHQEKALARINKHNPQQALSHSIEKGLKTGREQTTQLEAGPSNKQTKASDDSGLELDNSNAKVVSDPVMDIYMKSSGNATVDHLSKHLAVRGQFNVLKGSFSLELVSEKYWKVNKLMELHYAPTKEHE
ncbi:hypothetical protein FD754_005912, partial [Muntiacus muntjak]